ncbi:hypothetical protein ELE36_01720 [Pseudolysobacter antarcticus]|uniref:DUF4156 domain-containing protein n=1 Tax=Pseudolysobacter antarcticus TaxID=2511995 RepID=A0A411HFD1_9GAMM|nr:hypothetical protein [Pseudolysobacter antarcticus]QBB69196.1 hypothetical protein ELE36_01720 [Pseudolysobacter antarcticus]
MRSMFWVLPVLLVLGGCGGSPEQQAVDVCTQAVNAKLSGKSYALDAADMRNNLTTDNDKVVHVASKIAFDAGLSSEYKTAFDCRVRFEAGKPPTVIYLAFDWALDPNAKRPN